MSETRNIAAIPVADVIGYSRLAGADEDRILARLRALTSCRGFDLSLPLERRSLFVQPAPSEQCRAVCLTEGVMSNGNVSFRSVNFGNRFIRHQNFLAELQEIADVDDLAKQDASFVFHPGLAAHSQGFGSYEAVDFSFKISFCGTRIFGSSCKQRPEDGDPAQRLVRYRRDVLYSRSSRPRIFSQFRRRDTFT